MKNTIILKNFKIVFEGDKFISSNGDIFLKFKIDSFFKELSNKIWGKYGIVVSFSEDYFLIKEIINIGEINVPINIKFPLETIDLDGTSFIRDKKLNEYVSSVFEKLNNLIII